jgi:hypothetical protein
LVSEFAFAWSRNGAAQVGSPASQGLNIVTPNDSFGYSFDRSFANAPNLVLSPANATTGASSTHSDIIIDGHSAYTPETISGIAVDPATVPAISFSRSRSSTTGDFRVTETDPLSWCSGNAYPQSSGSCTVLSTGVKLVRSYLVSHSGQVATMQDHFVSTNGVSHSAKIEYLNAIQQQPNGTPGLMLPGQTSFKKPTAGTTINSLPQGPHTIFATSDMFATDGSPDRTDGGLTYSGKPQLFFASSEIYALRYTRTVRAVGGATLSFADEGAFTVSGVKSLAAAEQKALTPHLALTAPARTTTDNTPTIKGRVTNATNGFPAKVTITIGTKSKTVNVNQSTGAFQVTWTSLANGKHTAKAKATDPSGLVLSASRTFTCT